MCYQVLLQIWTQRNGNICKTSVSLRRQRFVKSPGFRWLKAFSEGRESIEDKPCSGRPSVSKTLKMSLESGILWVQIVSLHKNIPVAPQPLYSPDLNPCDFFLFLKLKNHLKEHHFGTLKNIQTAVTDQLKALPISEFHQCYEEWSGRNVSSAVCLQKAVTLKETMLNCKFIGIKK
ncbi:uncharacterized protein TNCV_4005891 [Trichonephila clavipes]|nr:uncharacterized protein TNCV_4005891 [Trichonephila clavipes]